MKRLTKLGSCFLRARGGLTLRAAEEKTGINRETWRSYEVGRVLQPSGETLAAAASLPGAPRLEDFISAVLADKEAQLRESMEPAPA